MSFSFKRAFSIIFTWFISLYGLFFSAIWVISIIRALGNVGSSPLGFDIFTFIALVAYLGLILAIIAPALVSVAISVLITIKLADQKNGFNVKQNKAYIVATTLAVLFVGIVSLYFFQPNYYEPSWVRLFALGSIPGVIIVVWAIQGAYLKTEPTITQDSNLQSTYS